MKSLELKAFLDEKAEFYENPDFIQHDPIQIPHQFSKKQDIEIMAFLISTLAWGNRKSIINSGNRLIQYFGNQPYDFVLNYKTPKQEYKFAHRTFNGVDLDYFLRALQQIYRTNESLENLFLAQEDMNIRLSNFKTNFFSYGAPERSYKHLGDPLKNSAAKRQHMFLRWMVRDSKKGVDFGIWKNIKPSELYCPLDVHTGNIARKLKLIKRKQNDQKTLQELQKKLVKFDPIDPIKYDFALFGLGAFEKF
jgi:uncharacterized protein (TIGR02757 family)